MPVFRFTTRSRWKSICGLCWRPRASARRFWVHSRFLALGLAAVGLYGMLAFAVAQQRFEIGLRRALGARGRDILAGVLRQGMRLALFGVGIGLVLSVGLGPLTASLLFGIEPVDPLVFGLAALVLVGTALLASYVPARRATQVDPIVEQPEVRRWYARMLLERDASGDREKDRELLGAARSAYEELGMPRYVEMVEALL